MIRFVPLLNLVEIFDGTFFFLTFIVACFGLAGLMSRNFTIAVFSAFTAFVTLTMKTGYTFYENLLYVVMVLILMLMSFQIYGMTQGNSAGASAGGDV